LQHFFLLPISPLNLFPVYFPIFTTIHFSNHIKCLWPLALQNTIQPFLLYSICCKPFLIHQSLVQHLVPQRLCHILLLSITFPLHFCSLLLSPPMASHAITSITALCILPSLINDLSPANIYWNHSSLLLIT